MPLKASVETSPPSKTSYTRLITFTVFLASLLALLHNSPLVGSPGTTSFGARGGVVKGRGGFVKEEAIRKGELVQRQNDPTDYCKIWSQQSAMINGTIYLFGGRKTTDADQTSDTWNNDFLTIDATKTWQITSPALSALPQPSGPPAVANGYLWHSFTSLFLYGGEYSDTPAASPSPFALWEYDIPSKTWSQHSSPSTAAGNNSDGGNQPVQAAAEGAGISIPSLGLGYFFGGHLDGYTVAGWSQSIPRVYLKSLLEFTFPGFTNSGVKSLATTPAGDGGAFRNITEGGTQGENKFAERADGALVYIPGFGQEGIVLGLAGGNNQSFQEMNIIDVYDIANSQWYQQFTSGSYPEKRVNPCSVAASAPDGSSTNVYMFGGQNLVPNDPTNQTQYNDMWILSIPSFNWIQVDQSGQSVPAGRSGHTCEIWDGQMIVVGGYLGKDISCESPGTFVFDLTQLKWQNQFTALSGGDPENQQSSQSDDPDALSGSYGYQVPAPVQSVIGGASIGGATKTAPSLTATGGPLATGAPVIYTVTGSNGAAVTETAPPGTVVVNGSSGSSGPNIAAIVAGTIAGVLFIIACYLGFCTWVYRRQLQLYKNHVSAAQRAAAAPPTEKTGFLGASLTRSSEDPSSRRSTDISSGPSSQRPGGRFNGGAAVPPVPSLPSSGPQRADSNANSSTEDLMMAQEPTFVGVLLNPRRSLRVVNRD